MRAEDALQKEIVKHLRWRGSPLMTAIHINNTPRNERDGARLKAMGLVPGVPDMVYPCCNGFTLWHEIKTEKGKLSDKQKNFHELLRKLGHEVITTYGKDDALAQLAERGIIRGW